MFKSTRNWILLTILSICLIIGAYKIFPYTFPIVQLDLQMSKNDALVRADLLSSEYQIGPQEKYQVTAFGLEQMEQNFIELDNGGSSKFIEILKDDYYMPYTWTVRHYYPGNINEAKFKFTPSGELYGFHEILPDSLYLDNLKDSDNAKIFAVQESSKNWDIDFDLYELVEEKAETKLSGRIDYTYVYKLKDYTLGDEGEFRLDLVVSGNKLTKVNHYIKIPESFKNKFKEMRSFNNTIAQMSTFALILFYVLGGIIIGLFFLNRERWIVWKPGIYWGLFVSIITMISGLNFLPLSWLSYDTALSSSTYITQIIIFTLINSFVDFIIVFLSFVAAESLSRKAFPEHVQFWKLWTNNNGASFEVVGRTIGGYLIVALDLFFVVSFYFITATYLGWWVPSGPLFEPNMIATPFPWLSAVGMSLHAGFWEECLFRAVPLSCAILIGNKYGKKTFWLIFALILQAVIFAGAHANYPSYPAYSRLVELIIPSLFWGFIFIRYGLLPVIISHFAYDVVWFSLPLFTSNSSDLIFDKIMVIILTFIPIWVILRARLKTGSMFNISSNFFNSSFIPSEIIVKTNENEFNAEDIKIDKNYRFYMIAFFIISILSLSSYTDNKYSNLNIEKSRNEAISIANAYIQDNNIDLGDEWTVISQFDNGEISYEDRYIWNELSPDVYDKLLGTYLKNAIWKIRYVRFTGDLNDKAEEYVVIINNNGTVYELQHKIPENRKLDTVDEISARIVSKIYINEKFSLIDEDIEEIKFEELKLPNRTDWVFEYSDKKTYNMDDSDLRIVVKISGNKVVQSNQYLYVPQEWKNNDQEKNTIVNIISLICSFLLIIIFLYATANSIAKWSKGNFNLKIFKFTFIILGSILLLSIINSYPQAISGFQPTKPFLNQFLTSIIGSVIYGLITAFSISSIFGYISAKFPKNTHQFNYIEIVLISVILIAAITKALMGSGVQSAPYWYENVQSINTFVPFFTNVFNFIQSYIYQCVFLLFITMIINKITNNGKRIAITLLCIAGLSFLYSGSYLGTTIGLQNPLSLINSTITLTLIYSAVYVSFIRFDISIIPMFIAISSAFTLIITSALGTFPGMMFTNIFSAILIIIVGYLLRTFILKNEN